MPLLRAYRSYRCRFGTQAMTGQLEATEYMDRFKHLLATNDIPLVEYISHVSYLVAYALLLGCPPIFWQPL